MCGGICVGVAGDMCAGVSRVTGEHMTALQRIGKR